MPKIVKTQGLSKKYHMGLVEVDALLDVALEVQKGEFVAVMGASGSGKSTLLHLLGGLDRPTSGEVILEDNKLSNLTDKKVTLLRRKEVGFVFQFFNLLPTLSAEENIALPFLISGKRPAQFQDSVDNILKLVGLAKRKSHRPDELSGGEQQRVAIGRALVTSPAIVLADEPTGNLDSKTGEGILSLLRTSCDKLNQTIIMVTHDPKAASFADRIVFLKDGKIVDELEIKLETSIAPIIEQLRKLDI